MNKEEYMEFLKSLLVKIENAINLLNQPAPKHIPSYRKMLGVQQKMSELPMEYRNNLFSQLICVRRTLNYFLNGRYEEAYLNIIKLKKDLVKIYMGLKNERDTDIEIQKD